jgi:hypothetical protein
MVVQETLLDRLSERLIKVQRFKIKGRYDTEPLLYLILKVSVKKLIRLVMIPINYMLN